MVPLKLIALSCEYLSSREILYIIDDYKLSSQENRYMINKRFIDEGRYTQILEKGIFEFPIRSKNLYPTVTNWECLSRNPAAIHLLQANPDKIDWFVLSQNPAAIHL